MHIIYIYREHETDGSTYPRCGKGSFAEAQLPEGERDAPRAGHSQLGSLARGTPRDERRPLASCWTSANTAHRGRNPQVSCVLTSTPRTFSGCRDVAEALRACVQGPKIAARAAPTWIFGSRHSTAVHDTGLQVGVRWEEHRQNK